MALFGHAGSVGGGAGTEAAAGEEAVDSVGVSEEESVLGLTASSSMWGVGADATAGEVVNSAPGDEK